MTRKKKRIGIFVILTVLVLAGLWMFIHRGQESTDDAQIEAHVVTISPKISGYVKTVNVVDNQRVKTGDVILEIDPADYIIKRDHAKYALEAAEARLNASGSNLETTKISAPSNMDAAKATVAAAQATLKQAQSELTRMKSLNDEARSRQQLDNAIAAEKNARASLENAKAQLKSAQTAPKAIAAAKSGRDELEAIAKQAEADLAQAEKDLADTKVLAPMDGRITKKGVEVGDYVEPGAAMGYLVSNEMWVVANYKETQLKHMRLGQSVDISVDAYGNELEGKIDSIQTGTGVRFSAFPPENASGNYVKIVQRVPVKITITSKYDDNEHIIGPGMSVTPIVHTE